MMMKQFRIAVEGQCYRSWGFRLIGGMDEGLVLKIDKATIIITVITFIINVIIDINFEVSRRYLGRPPQSPKKSK